MAAGLEPVRIGPERALGGCIAEDCRLPSREESSFLIGLRRNSMGYVGWLVEEPDKHTVSWLPNLSTLGPEIFRPQRCWVILPSVAAAIDWDHA